MAQQPVNTIPNARSAPPSPAAISAPGNAASTSAWRDGLSTFGEQVKNYFKENPRLQTALAAGLGTAALGGGLTALSKRKNESRGERRMRILRNLLLAGGAGAGATLLGGYSAGQLATADPEKVDPVVQPLKYLMSGLTGASAVGASRFAGRDAEHAVRSGNLSQLREFMSPQDPNRPNPRNQNGGTARLFNGSAADQVDRALQNHDPSATNSGRAWSRAGRSQRIMTDLEQNLSPDDLAAFMRDAGVSADNMRAGGYVRPIRTGGGVLNTTGDTGRWLLDYFRRFGRRTLGGGSRLQRTARAGGIGLATAAPYALMTALEESPQLADNALGYFRYADNNQ